MEYATLVNFLADIWTKTLCSSQEAGNQEPHTG